MAHSDYNCCAVCDSKMEYSHDAETKERICADCTITMNRELRLDIFTADEFIAYIERTPLADLEPLLRTLHFRRCYYANPVDEAVLAKGIEIKAGDCLRKSD